MRGSNGHGLFSYRGGPEKGQPRKEVDRAKAAREWKKAEARLAAKKSGKGK